MKAFFVYLKYFDFETNTVTVGGVQTYIQGLIPVFESLGFECYIYQAGDSEQTVCVENMHICQLNTSLKENNSDKIQCLVEKISEIFDNEKDFLIFMANELTCKNHFKNTITIQHGISWDTLSEIHRPKWQNKLAFALKAKKAYRIIDKLGEVNQIVCVDHNFKNWLKSTAVRFWKTMKVIPNFTKIAPQYNKPEDRVEIIFARRFFPYRGTRLFTEAIKIVLKNNKNVFVTLAGNGPDEAYMRSELESFSSHVYFTQYRAEEALSIHADKHIAVVPTMGSEGTSLSLLEAMSAQCAVVATDVGGISNIVIDGFNALYCENTPEDLAHKIQLLIDDSSLRERLADKAYETVKYGFSYETWAMRWREMILQMMEDVS